MFFRGLQQGMETYHKNLKKFVNSSKEPIQVSKEFYKGKFQKVGFYQTKKGIVIRPIK